MKSRIIGQIHDSILLDVHRTELNVVLVKAKQIMTELLPQAWPWVIVPMEVEAEVAPLGKSWYDKTKEEIQCESPLPA